MFVQAKLALAKETAQRLKDDLKELSSDDSEDEDNEEVNVHYSAFMQQKKMPPEFWIVQKLIRYPSSHLKNKKNTHAYSHTHI